MKVVLRSDFADYYDHAFDRVYGAEPSLEFRRLLAAGPDRPAMFRLLGGSLPVPRHGTVGELAEEGVTLLVVYTDPHAHRGEGKRVMTVDRALLRYPDAFASAYIYRPGHPRSYRTLQVGARRFRLRYDGWKHWCSNVGNPLVSFLGEVDPTPALPFPSPLWAVDSVPDQRGTEYAVDVNVAPGMRGSGIERVLAPAAVYRLIREALCG